MSEEEPGTIPPPWMIDLEKRLETVKQLRKLGHEMGAGAKCLICKDKCPGLELHFWRKRCISCKCKKEEHDVPPDDSSLRFEILLHKDNSNRFKSTKSELNLCFKAPNSKNAALNSLLKGSSTLPPERVKFDWVPPDVSEELATEYMTQLPVSKLPISGTSGAKHRQKQIEKQIPLYDVNPEQWHKLSGTEQEGFQKYLKNVRENVVGQGKVQKIFQKQYLVASTEQNLLQAQKSGNIRPNQTSNKDTMSEGHNININFPEDPSNINLNQQDSGSYLHDLRNRNLPTNYGLQPVSDEDTAVPGIPSSNIMPSYKLASSFTRYPVPFKSYGIVSHSGESVGGVDDLSEALASSVITKDNNSSNENTKSSSSDKTNEPLSSPLSQEEFPQRWNKTASTSTIGTMDEDKIAEPSKTEENSSVAPPNPKEGYEFNTQYGFDSYPSGYSATSTDPNNSGFLLRNPKEVNFNLPDDNIRLDITNANQAVQEQEPHLSVEKLMACSHCTKPIKNGSVAVLTDRAGPGMAWHPQCFVCNVCNELLVDLIYFYHKQKVYCGRHYAEIMEILRCHACDELIFVNQYTEAEGKAYHVRHFCCADCDVELGGRNYVVHGDQNICVECLEANYSKRCIACKKVIRAKEQGVHFEGAHWHADPSCFCCANCSKSLLGSRFMYKKNHPFCSAGCVQSFNY